MTMRTGLSPRMDKQDPTLSPYHLLDPEVLANLNPLYHRFLTEDPVHWDPILHTWFVPNPFSQKPDARLYKTGDLARYRPDGKIEFLGRIDHQVKVHGFRIELGGIETVLGQHPEVQEIVVVVRENIPGNKRLVAYIVATQGQSLVIKNLRSYLKEKLPEYMLPSAFMLLDALPLTPNGKIDRRALPAPKSVKLTEEEMFVAPTLPMHYQLMQIWEELLDARPIRNQGQLFPSRRTLFTCRSPCQSNRAGF